MSGLRISHQGAHLEAVLLTEGKQEKALKESEEGGARDEGK